MLAGCFGVPGIEAPHGHMLCIVWCDAGVRPALGEGPSSLHTCMQTMAGVKQVVRSVTWLCRAQRRCTAT